MSTLTKTLGAVSLALAGLSLQAEDFTSLMQVVKTTWPEKNHIGVICDYRNSQAQVEDLARAAGSGAHITVVDVRVPEKGSLGAQLLANHQANFLVMLPHDRLVRDGSFDATVAIRRLAKMGIPSVGTTSRSLGQGAVFSLGEGTGGELLITPKLIGTVDVILPAGITYSRKASLPLGEGMATISVAEVK
jgi:hypothetical protein